MKSALFLFSLYFLAVVACTPLRLQAHPGDITALDLRPAASDAQCVAWDDRRLAWGAVGSVAGVLSGAGGAVATLTPLADKDDARLALGLTSLALAGTTALAAYLMDGYTERYSAHCAAPTSSR